jgi:hypothetical protein
MRSLIICILREYNQNDQVKEDEMGRAYSKHGKRFWWVIQKETDHYEGTDVDGRIILKWILDK